MSVYTEVYKGYTIKVEQDEDSRDPRVDYDHVGTMACFYGSYELGDKDHGIDSDDYITWQEMREAIEAKHDIALILPLFLYHHGTMRMKVGSFQGLLSEGHAEFDSGQVGFLFVTKQKAQEEGVPDLQKCLEAEVEEYDAYLRGAVYCYTTKDPEGEDIDSCCGYIGDPEDNGMLSDARAQINHNIEDERKKHTAKRKAEIRHHAPLDARQPLKAGAVG